MEKIESMRNSGKDEFHLVPLLFLNIQGNAMERVLTTPACFSAALWTLRQTFKIGRNSYDEARASRTRFESLKNPAYRPVVG
jgi:hypothetical protein